MVKCDTCGRVLKFFLLNNLHCLYLVINFVCPKCKEQNSSQIPYNTTSCSNCGVELDTTTLQLSHSYCPGTYREY